MLHKEAVEHEGPAGVFLGHCGEDIDEADWRRLDAILQHTHKHLQSFLGTSGFDVPTEQCVPGNRVPLGHRVEQPPDDVDAAVATVPHAGGVDVEERVAEHRGVGQRARAAEEVRVDGFSEAEAAGAGTCGERAGVRVVVGARRGARGVVEESVEPQRVFREGAGHVSDEERVVERRRRRARERVEEQQPRAVQATLFAQPPHLRRRRVPQRLHPAPAPDPAAGAGTGGIGMGLRERNGAAGSRKHETVALARGGDSSSSRSGIATCSFRPLPHRFVLGPGCQPLTNRMRLCTNGPPARPGLTQA